MSLINQLSINSQIQIEIQGLISSKIQGWYGQIFFVFPSLELKDLNLVLIGDTMDTCPRSVSYTHLTLPTNREV